MPYYHIYAEWEDEIGSRFGKNENFSEEQVKMLSTKIEKGLPFILKNIKVNPYGITKLEIWKTANIAIMSKKWDWIRATGEIVTNDFVISLPTKPESPPIEEKVYPKGHTYDYYNDIRDITKDAKSEVFVIDAYVDEELLNLYLEKIPIDVKIRILTNKPQGNFITVAQKFKTKPRVDFEVRRSNDCHDRLFFIDDKCWVMGQSIKDAGKKPTYLAKIEGYALFKKVFDDLWNTASKLV